MRYINGIRVDAKEFFFDGCHKFYIPENGAGYRHMYDHGWDEGDLFPIEELPAIWVGSCPLRFIESADLSKCFVRQCEPAEFKGWRISTKLKLELDEMRREQLEVSWRR